MITYFTTRKLYNPHLSGHVERFTKEETRIRAVRGDARAQEEQNQLVLGHSDLIDPINPLTNSQTLFPCGSCYLLLAHSWGVQRY